MAEIHPDPIEERRRHRSESHKATTYGTFLNDLSANGGYTKEFAERAASSVLCCLEQRITADEARQMEAQLPARLRELLTRCERHANLKARHIGRREFITMISEDLNLGPQEAELVARNVLRTVREHISEGEAAQVENQLPLDLRDFWWRPA